MSESAARKLLGRLRETPRLPSLLLSSAGILLSVVIVTLWAPAKDRELLLFAGLSFCGSFLAACAFARTLGVCGGTYTFSAGLSLGLLSLLPLTMDTPTWLKGSLTERLLAHVRLEPRFAEPTTHLLVVCAVYVALGVAFAGLVSLRGTWKAGGTLLAAYVRQTTGGGESPAEPRLTYEQQVRLVSVLALAVACTLLLQALVFGLVGDRVLATVVAVLFVLAGLGFATSRRADALEAGARLDAPGDGDEKWFDKNANRFLSNLTARWRLLTWAFGGFVTVAGAFLGFNVYGLAAELREGRVAQLKQEMASVQLGMKSVMGLTSDFAQAIGRVSATSDEYNRAISATSSSERDGIGLDDFRLRERLIDLDFFAIGIALRESAIVQQRATGAIDDARALRAAHETQRFTEDVIAREPLLKYCDPAANGFETNFVEPFLAAADEKNNEGSATDTDVKSLTCVATLMLEALSALKEREQSAWSASALDHEKAEAYQRYLASKLLTNTATLAFKVQRPCATASGQGATGLVESKGCVEVLDLLQKIVKDAADRFVSLGVHASALDLPEPGDKGFRARLLTLTDELANAANAELAALGTKLEGPRAKSVDVLKAHNEFIQARVESKLAEPLAKACSSWTESCKDLPAGCPVGGNVEECKRYAKDMEAARKLYLDAIRDAKSGGAESYPAAMHTLGYYYASSSYFDGRWLEALRYAHLAVQGIAPRTLPWLYASETYATALERIGAHSQAAKWRALGIQEVPRLKRSKERNKGRGDPELRSDPIGDGVLKDLCGFYADARANAPSIQPQEAGLSAEAAYRAGAFAYWSARAATGCDERERDINAACPAKGGSWVAGMQDANTLLSRAYQARPDDPRVLTLLNNAQSQLRERQQKCPGVHVNNSAEVEGGSKASSSGRGQADELLRLHVALGGELVSGTRQEKSTYATALNNNVWRALEKCDTSVASELVDFTIDAAISGGWGKPEVIDTLAWAWLCSERKGGAPPAAKLKARNAYNTVACLDPSFPSGYEAPPGLEAEWKRLTVPAELAKLRTGWCD